jgi:hypothetical protein
VDVQQEADRLLSLDDDGLEREMLVVALRLGEAASRAWAELRSMDEEFLHVLTSDRAGNGSAPEGA